MSWRFFMLVYLQSMLPTTPFYARTTLHNA